LHADICELLPYSLSMMLPQWVASVFVGLQVIGTGAFQEANKYLVASSPSTHQVAYALLPSGGYPDGGVQMRVLINSGLTNPQGIAVDQHRRRLYVADPALTRLVFYTLRPGGSSLTVGAQETAVNSVETRWVAVDGVGNVYFTDEPYHRVMRLSAHSISTGSMQADIIYDGAFLGSVSAPGGIAVDNYFVYWTNKESGTQVGSVIRGRELPGVVNGSSVEVVANNVVKSYGVCLAPRGSIFYTDERSNLFGARGTGDAVTVSAGFVQPRGCSFDGDATVYIADKYLNAIYAFPARTPTLEAGAQMIKAAEIEGAFGVAVYSAV